MVMTATKRLTVYESLVRAAVRWLVQHTSKPETAAYTVLVAWISGGLVAAAAVIAQTDLGNLDVGNVVGTVTGLGLILWAVKFLRSVYGEALEVTRQNLEAERQDRIEDRARYAAEIESRDKTINRLEKKLDKALEELAHVKATVNGG